MNDIQTLPQNVSNKLTLPVKAAEILDEEYNVDIIEFHGELMLSAKTDSRRNINSFCELGEVLIKNEIRFTYETEAFILEIHDFKNLCAVLIKGGE